jgi:hypothetical protein
MGHLALAVPSVQRHIGPMLNALSILIGLFALVCMIPAVIPLLGALNWILVPVALVGAVVGMLSSKNGGRNFCLLVAAFGAFRLFLGGGLI